MQSLFQLSGGVLAGGEGRRFGGRDKGWIEHDGLPFIEHVLRRLRPQVDEVVISANRNLHRYQALGHRTVQDRLGAGPLAGLLRLLETARHGWLLSTPCDALTLPQDLAERMLAVQRRSGADIVVLTDAAGTQPTVSLLRAALAADLEAFLRAGGRALWAWQARHELAFCRIEGRLANINGPEALRELETAHG